MNSSVLASLQVSSAVFHPTTSTCPEKRLVQSDKLVGVTPGSGGINVSETRLDVSQKEGARQGFKRNQGLFEVS